MARWLPAARGEWREGWRIVLGCALASATGVALLFFTFSLFLLPLAAELNVTRGQLGIVQALIITAALGSPVIGRMTDIYGFRPVYFACTLIVATIQVTTALLGSTIWHMAISIALTGFFSVGSTAVAITRPISAHFRVHRGKALGLVAVGASVTTMFMPPILQEVLDAYSWRGGFIALAAISVCIGIPSVALLLPRNSGRAGSGVGAKSPPPDYGFMKVPDFWFMTLSNVAMSTATAGAVSQMSPMIQEEGISAATAALALSVYAAGQFAGRLGGGWLLDRFEPRRVAFLLTLVPGMGFIVLLLTTGLAPAALFAAAMIGLQQGAELDIFAYFVSRRFEVAKYGTVYGALVGIGWIGNAAGIIGVGLLHDATGSYAIWQAFGAVALLVGALLILPVRLPAREEPA